MNSADFDEHLVNRRPLYVAAFESFVDRTEPYEVIVEGPDDHPVSLPHGLDKDLLPVLPGLWHLLRLPRTMFEVLDLPGRAVKAHWERRLEHCILLAPIDHLATLTPDEDWPPNGQVPALVVATDPTFERAKQWSDTMGFLLPAVSVSELGDEMVGDQWESLYHALGLEIPPAPKPPPAPSSDRMPLVLPVQRMLSQLNQSAAGMDSDDTTWIEDALSAHTSVEVLASMEGDGLVAGDQDLQQEFAERAERLAPTTGIRISLSAPGVADPAQTALRRLVVRDDAATSAAVAPPPESGDAVSDEAAEEDAIRLLVTHSALRDDGLGLTWPTIPASMFNRLRGLEDHWMAGPTPRKVWSALDRLDAEAVRFWTDEVVLAISRASQLTVFSNFPIGLLRLPGDTAPLSCRVPIAYRPLTPLTRALQSELAGEMTVVPNAARVLIAEAILPDDRIGAISRSGWRLIADSVGIIPENNCEFRIEEVASSEQLRLAIATHQPDILVLSAHGTRRGNAAGIMVGRELSLGDNLGDLPPVVILSACHVSPRGAGSVNIADVMLRQGAVAVLGPQVPVDVRKNALLTSRLLVQILLALTGEMPHQTMLEAWRYTQSSHAIVDVLTSSRRLNEWGHSRMPDGTSVMQHFMGRGSVGRIRPNHVYEDTLSVLRDMGDEAGRGDEVRRLIGLPFVYTPESAMYTFIGRPDSVYLRLPEPFSV